MLIYKKINEIMKKVKTVMKDKTVGFGNNAYAVVTYDRLLNVIRDHLIDEEVIIVPSQEGAGIYTESITNKGTKKLRYDAIYNIAFIAIEDGSKVVIRIEVSADTFGDDKGPSKAITIATKNATLKAFSLESGENEGEEERQNSINQKQAVMLQKLVTSTESDEQEFLTFYGAETYSDFPSGYFQDAVNKLQAKMKKAKK